MQKSARRREACAFPPGGWADAAAFRWQGGEKPGGKAFRRAKCCFAAGLPGFICAIL